jgi:hypothetical protein
MWGVKEEDGFLNNDPPFLWRILLAYYQQPEPPPNFKIESGCVVLPPKNSSGQRTGMQVYLHVIWEQRQNCLGHNKQGRS